MKKRIDRNSLDNEVSKRYYDQLKPSKKYLTPVFVGWGNYGRGNYVAGGKDVSDYGSKAVAKESLLDKSKYSRDIETSMFLDSATDEQKKRYWDYEKSMSKLREKQNDFVDSILFIDGVNPRKIK